MPMPMPNHNTHHVGTVSVTRVTEQCGPGFAPEFLFPDWDPAVLAAHHDLMIPHCYDAEERRFIASIHSWVIRTRHHTILVDGCAGNHKWRPDLPRFHQLDTPFLARLAEAGVRPEAVDFVLCTHLHADHVGWNTQLRDGRWVPTFPNATYVFSRAERDHWEGAAGHSGFNAGVFTDSVLPVIEAGQATLAEEIGAIGDEIHFHPTPGHSVGHIAIELSAGGALGLFSGDIMHQPLQVVRPDWNSRFCEDARQACASRRWLLESAAERQATVFTAHFAASSAGTVTSGAAGFHWTFA
ncbi:MBL fold metallo-hydrolase [Azospirillum picis]|uniref:Glyoxylase-like metal-dependent hydrolase (Beta-lactamase superfamily II) n=1 Tax=Azospirillum picis TaxID=488438 RepID=A0ABU0MJB8_9PROT|nr:MBL fold metallo-hydrolase [Azospirillum picis]MBP2299765.1 glyoxylase-like metal-dependent hydrolase (beta-lactamase superfamily II) [Azospirillum picis]MDQ0533561.1 glyoxylase-like metal-dependent hydrolase (beta-lactamase superfamily II) [Azospirillum picis]